MGHCCSIQINKSVRDSPLKQNNYGRYDCSGTIINICSNCGRCFSTFTKNNFTMCTKCYLATKVPTDRYT